MKNQTLKNKPELILLAGMSGAGKTTYARYLVEKGEGRTISVSRDKLRETLFSYDEVNVLEHYSNELFNKREKFLSFTLDEIITSSLIRGKNVVVDVTNLTDKYIEHYRKFNVETSLLIFDCNKEQAIERVSRRNRKVQVDVMHTQYNKIQSLKSLYHITEEEGDSLDFLPSDTKIHYIFNRFKEETIIQDPSLPEVVILDIDGTIAQKGDRDIYDGSKVHLDSKIEWVDRLRNRDIPTIICTGRDDEFREVTEKWLDDNGFKYEEIFFRKKGDQRPDWIVKEEFWREISTRRYIVGCIDDRQNVVDRCRSLGLNVMQVNYGKF